jgi:hypothetical protein
MSGYTAGSSGAKAIAPRGVGGENFAWCDPKRELPTLIASLGNFKGLTLNHGDQNTVIKQFRNAWTPTTSTEPPNGSGSLSIGGDDPVFGHRVGYLVSGSYGFSTDLKDGQVRALADRGNTPGETKPSDVFTGQTSSQSVLWGGLANLSTMIGEGSRIAFSGIYNRTADNDARVENGSFENEGFRARITRMQYVEREVHSGQLTGDHQVGAHRLNWAFTSSGVRRDEPDRSEFVQVITQASPTAPEVLKWQHRQSAARAVLPPALRKTVTKARATISLAFQCPRPRAQHQGRRTGAQDDAERRHRAYSIAPQAPATTSPASTPSRSSTAGSRIRPTACLHCSARRASYDANDRPRRAM